MLRPGDVHFSQIKMIVIMGMINDSGLICQRIIKKVSTVEKVSSLDDFRALMAFDEIKWNLMNFNEL